MRWLAQLARTFWLRGGNRSGAGPFSHSVAILSLTLRGVRATSAIFSVIFTASNRTVRQTGRNLGSRAAAVDDRGGHTYQPREVAEMAAGSLLGSDEKYGATVLLTGDHSPESFRSSVLLLPANTLGKP